MQLIHLIRLSLGFFRASSIIEQTSVAIDDGWTLRLYDRYSPQCCRKFGLSLVNLVVSGVVQAAWGGGVLFSETYRHLLNGLNRVDSLTMSLHKLMGAQLQSAVLLTNKQVKRPIW